MESADLILLLGQLDDNVDDLEEAILPILESTVIETSKKLPVLDKAKFHVMITYTLESLIFCTAYLRLHGVNSKEHPVFRELTRVKQYFEKIKALETEPEKRRMVLDKQAAGRFIKHGLAGNGKLDLQREEQLAKEKAREQLRASILAKKASATPETSSKPASSHSDANSDADPQSGRESDAEINDTQGETKTSKNRTGKRKYKEGKAKSSGDKVERKKRGSKERRARRNERRQKKEESRDARKAA